MRQNFQKHQCLKMKYTHNNCKIYTCRTKLNGLISIQTITLKYILCLSDKNNSFMLLDIIYYLTQFFRKYLYI